MQHPFIDTQELQKKSLDELQADISGLTGKLTFAYRMQNTALVAQLQMAIESYKSVYNNKMQEVFKKQNIPDQVSIKKVGEQ